MTDIATLEQQVADLTSTVKAQALTINFLSVQVQNLYLRLQLPAVDMTAIGGVNPRTETGMGAFISPDKTPYL